MELKNPFHERRIKSFIEAVKNAKPFLRIEKNFVNVELPSDLPDDKPDNRILKVCMGLADTAKDSQVILVTKDIVLRLKAQILGMKAEDFERERVSDDDAQYTGRTEVYFPEDMIKEILKIREIMVIAV